MFSSRLYSRRIPGRSPSAHIAYYQITKKIYTNFKKYYFPRKICLGALSEFGRVDPRPRENRVGDTGPSCVHSGRAGVCPTGVSARSDPDFSRGACRDRPVAPPRGKRTSGAEGPVEVGRVWSQKSSSPKIFVNTPLCQGINLLYQSSRKGSLANSAPCRVLSLYHRWHRSGSPETRHRPRSRNGADRTPSLSLSSEGLTRAKIRSTYGSRRR